MNGLSNACMTGNLELVKLALLNGVKPDGQTLNFAIGSRNVDIVKVVCFAQAPPAKDSLTKACLTGIKEIVDYTLVAGAQPGPDTLTECANGGNIEVFNMVCKIQGATVDHTTLNAVLPKWPWLASWLVDCGAKTDAETLSRACEVKQTDPNNRDKIIEAVVKAGGKPNAQTLFNYLYGCDTHHTQQMNSCAQLGINALIQSGLTFSMSQLQTYEGAGLYRFLRDRWHQNEQNIMCTFLINIGFLPTAKDVQTHLQGEHTRLNQARYRSDKRLHGGETETNLQKRMSIVSNAIKALCDAYFDKYHKKLL